MTSIHRRLHREISHLYLRDRTFGPGDAVHGGHRFSPPGEGPRHGRAASTTLLEFSGSSGLLGLKSDLSASASS